MKLTKREIIMLAALIIIALIFIEFRLILTPGMARLNELTERQTSLELEYQNINFNIALAKNMEKTRDENLIKIGELSVPFLNGVASDALLVFTHEMMLKHGFVPDSFAPSPLTSEILQPAQAEISRLTYRLKEIAIEYRELAGEEPGEPGGNGETPPAESTDDVVEVYTLQVRARAGYDQIKDLIDDFDSLGRHIIITNINMSPAQDQPELLDVEFWISYYGIEKLIDAEDPLNTWMREAIEPIQDNPFIQPETAIEPLEPVP